MGVLLICILLIDILLFLLLIDDVDLSVLIGDTIDDGDDDGVENENEFLLFVFVSDFKVVMGDLKLLGSTPPLGS